MSWLGLHFHQPLYFNELAYGIKGEVYMRKTAIKRAWSIGELRKMNEGWTEARRLCQK